MPIDHLTEEDLDEYLVLRDIDDSELTQKQKKRRDDILVAAMFVRIFGGKFDTESANEKVIKIVLK